MLTTIGVILVAMVAVATVEIWLFWRLGEREDRRRGQGARTAHRPRTGASMTSLAAAPAGATTQLAPAERPMPMGKGPADTRPQLPPATAMQGRCMGSRQTSVLGPG